jgi:phosphoglycolate phosphatase-like HAD superfamily hydrolase
VLWGYGSGEELAAAGATLLLATPREIVPAVLGREPEIS